MKTDLERLLEGSNTIARQAKVIAALQHENELLREKLAEKDRFDISADTAPALRYLRQAE